MLQIATRTITVLLCLLLAACGGSGGEGGSAASKTNTLDTAGISQRPSSSGSDSSTPSTPDASTTRVAANGPVPPKSQPTPAPASPVTAPPASLALGPYYKKYLDANGIPVVAAAEVDDRALIKVKHVIDTMLARRKDVRDTLVAASSRFLIIPKDKGITTLPEYNYLKQVSVPDGYADWDARARGMGGLHTSCGEENILRLSDDRYYGQGICVHEFAHTMLTSGMASLEPAFFSQLSDHYNAIREKEFIVNTYMATNVDEYWATAVQAWHNTGVCKPAPDGVYGPLCDHHSLGLLDPGGYELVNRLFNPPLGVALY